MLLFAVAGLGVNVAVTPAGNVDVVNVTLPAKPPLRARLIVVCPVAPGTTLNAAGVAVSVKSGVALEVIVSWTTTVFSVTPLPVARTVTFVTPATAALPALKVNVLLVTPAPKFAGLNVAVTFAGKPSAATVTAPAKPPCRSSVSATVPF